ncbi:TetR/AcrR family transcriptional regulator [Saccharibacillus sp. CPCC 101409]|uniref:TetR/AcrR family transcriptional regulator n=1 Tax=Saccharibacillus sp. CPCC 101409 TaxID=3058041 RepID=UPI0026735A00|nr:TetR/AcrR family transcriptional regulator [Saccharibacillus sp. CPCC 101409]MDO3410487.1 TetR/AcrR family transcriptional regulator [Saccharibacillus sp. CPCC 101409]
MRVLKKPEERRNDILDAAEALFASKGYTKATILDILQETGIAKGTFYYYFQSKEEVMNAIVMRYIGYGEAAALRIARDPALSAADKILHIVTRQGADTDGKSKVIEQLHDVENAQMHQKSLVETILRLSPILTRVVEQGIEEGVFRTSVPREAVEFLLISSQFLLDRGIFGWESEEIARKAYGFAAIAETLLGARSGTFAYIAELYESSPTINESRG